MPFDVIPAIDVSQQKLCRMTLGGPAVVKEYGGDPLAAAAAYAASGLKWLHLVDVDLAFTGTPANVGIAAAIHARSPEIAIQASGGFASRADVERYLDIGASRVVIGSAALADRESAEALLAAYFDVVVVGIETEGPRIRPRGRGASIDLDLAETLAWLEGLGVPRMLHTSVRRVGGLKGPDLEGLKTVLGAGRPVLAAGGIASLRDLLAVRAAGAEGAVIGRAALERGVDLAAAARELNGGDQASR